MATPNEEPTSENGSFYTCFVFGFVSLAAGLYFLFNPSEGVSNITNLHRLTLGETFTICGSIFIAAGIRPRPVESRL
jgi:uncharacterized membrane protein HdeD (DUF308 family)